MKEFILLNEEETREIAKQLWDSPKMQDFLIEKYDFYKTKDGLIFELEKVKKISIDKTDERYFKRYLTNEEEKDFIKLMFERKNQYIDRLKKYFKKYNSKITTSGYWANR